MCDPVTLLVGAGTALKAGGGLLRGFTESAAGRTEAAIMRARAGLIRRQGVIRENALRRDVRSTLASQAAWFAANNIDPASGSPLVIAGLSAAAGEMDARLVRSEAIIEAAGEEFNAGSREIEAKQALVAGILGAGTTLLSAAAGPWAGFGGGGGKAGFVGRDGIPIPGRNPFFGS